jgi:beta-lactam-binding protein with PASTA domain
VVGLKLAKAKAKIRARHCGVGKIRRIHASPAKRGRVVAQTPRAGKTLRRGAKVNLKVGR